MINSREKYDLGVGIAKTRTEGRSADEKPTKAEQGHRDRVEELGGWDADVQQGYDDTLREHVQTRDPDAANPANVEDVEDVEDATGGDLA